MEAQENQKQTPEIQATLSEQLCHEYYKSVMMCVIKFYKFYDIEIYSLPKINQKSIQKPQPIYYSDLPDKEMIREEASIATPIMKAEILFICSSECGRAETLGLKIPDYIDALTEYIPNKNMNIFEIIDLIEDDDTDVKKFHVKSPEFVKIENEKNKLDRLRADIDSLKGMIGK